MATAPKMSPRPTASGSPSARKVSLADVTSKGNGLPNRYILHGAEKTGKTSFGCQMPSPIFIQTCGETGLETLINAGQVPETAHFPQCETWDELLSCIDVLTEGEHEHKTLVIDTMNGAERLCHEHVCRIHYGGDWGKEGFTGYMRGAEVALSDWRIFLNKLDTLRSTRKLILMALCHTKVKNFKNPEGADYDRYQPDMNEKTWGLSHKWADAVLFLNFETFVDQTDTKKKGKATSTQQRFLYTVKHAAYDAGNRLGLPDEIDMGSSAEEAMANFRQAIADGRSKA